MGKARNQQKNTKHNNLHETIQQQQQHIVKKQMPYLNMMERFVETISQANDSGAFDGSFEVKHIVSPDAAGVPKMIRHRCITELDRDKIEQFVRDFEERQMLNRNNNNYSNLNQQNDTTNNNNMKVTVEQEVAKETHKNSPYLYRKAKAIYQNSWIASRNSSPRSSTPEPVEIQRNNAPERASLRSAARMLQFFATKKNKSPTKTAISTDDDDDELDSSIDSSSPAFSNSSAETSFEMHPPLVPTFKVTPPPIIRSKRSSGSKAASEFARFLRGSFHAKRAAVTTLTRSLSDSQHYHNGKTSSTNKQQHYSQNKKSGSTASSSMSSSQSSLSSPEAKTESKALQFILKDTTNQQSKHQHSKQKQQKQLIPKVYSIRVSHF